MPRLRDIWRGLTRRRLRTALTAGGIAIGTAMVVIISGIGTVGGRALSDEMERMGINGLSVSSSEGLTYPCLSSIRQLPMVTEAMPLLIKYASAYNETVCCRTVCCGIDAGADQVISLQLLYGRMLTEGDVIGEEPVCMVDEALAEAAFGRTDAVGQTVTVMLNDVPQDMRVVGVTAAGSSLLQVVTSMIPYMLYTPYTTLQTAIGSDTFDQIAVRVEDAADTGAAEELIRETLRRSQEEIGTLMTEDLAAQRDRLERIIALASTGLSAIGAVSLLVSGFGIMTVMLSAVQERTREIGIKKAIGATRGHILAEFLAGSLIISIIGTLTGLGVGIACILIGCTLLDTAPLIPWSRIALLALLTVLSGTLFGAYPAAKAASLRPVDALRREN